MTQFTMLRRYLSMDILNMIGLAFTTQDNIDVFAVFLLTTFAFFCVPLLLYGLAGVWGLCWVWLNDYEERHKNYLDKFRFGAYESIEELEWKLSPPYGAWKYYKGESYETKTNHTDVVDTSMEYSAHYLIGFTLAFPVICFVCYLPTVTMIIGLAVAVALLARLGVRGNKVLRKHINDKEVHNALKQD